MSKHQLRIQSGKKDRTRTDARRVEGFLAGDETLAGALGLAKEQITELRAQAHALYHAARWDRCIEVVLALAALGDVEPWDAVIIARAYERTGDHANAAVWGAAAEDMLADVQLLLTHPSNEGTSAT